MLVVQVDVYLFEFDRGCLFLHRRVQTDHRGESDVLLQGNILSVLFAIKDVLLPDGCV